MASDSELLDLWMLFCSALILVGLAGLTLMESGYSRKAFSINLLVKNYFQFAIGIIFWWLIGFGFALGDTDSEFIGEDHFGGEDWEKDNMFSKAVFYGLLGLFALFIINLCIIERLQFWVYPMFAAFFMVWVYPVIVAWGWGNGWLMEEFDAPFFDDGGSVAVHILAGSCALGALIITRPRLVWKERYAEKKPVRPYFEAQNFSFVIIGGMLFVLGLIGANMGRAVKMSEAAQSFFNTWLGGSACSLTTIMLMALWNRDLEKYYFGLYNGFIAGIVAVSGMTHNVEPYDAFSMGVLQAPIFIGILYLVPFLKGDDVGAVIATHLSAGIWGTFGTGFFENKHGTWHTEVPGERETLGAQVVAFSVVTAWGLFWSIFFFGILRLCGLLKVHRIDDKEGLKNIQVDICSYICGGKAEVKSKKAKAGEHRVEIDVEGGVEVEVEAGSHEVIEVKSKKKKHRHHHHHHHHHHHEEHEEQVEVDFQVNGAHSGQPGYLDIELST